MDIYQYNDYKKIIAHQLKTKRLKNPKYSLKKLADLIDIQYTYLSKLMNHETSHFSEDQLLSTVKFLGLYGDELDYLLLLRQLSVCRNEQNKIYIKNKIDNIQKSKELNINKKEFSHISFERDLEYLLNPFVSIIHLHLHIKEYQSNPYKLCSSLQISRNKLKDILNTLENMNYIKWNQDRSEIIKCNNAQFHIDKSHPLMRSHQLQVEQLSKALCINIENEKLILMQANFTASETAISKIDEEFKIFLKKVEEISRNSKAKKVYHLSFKLHDWT